MAAANTDKFRKKKNLFSTTLNGGITADATSLTCNSLSGVPTDTAITITIDRVDANGLSTPTYREDVTGVVSGSNVTNLVRGEGATTAQVHASGAVVELTWETETWNDAVDGILVGHDQDGSHKSGIVLTAPQINDTTADHQYIIAVSELTADRTVTLPLLTGNDDFVFEDHAQTLTNKTLTSPVIATISNTGTITLPTDTDTLVGKATTDTLTNKTLTSPVINTGVSGTALASGSDVIAGTSETKVVTPKALADGEFIKARAYRSSTAQTITNNTTTKIQLNAETFDTGSDFDSSTNYRFVAPIAGYYVVCAQIHWTTGTDQANTQILIYKNGSVLAQSITHASGTGDYNQNISEIVYLAQDEYVELYAGNYSGGNKDVGAGSERTFMSIARLF